MANFPMFVSLKNKKCLVVGGGNVAKRKADVLISYGADVTVIAQDIKFDFNCNAIKKSFTPNDIGDYYIVVAATDDRAVNSCVADICNNRGINVNVADSSSESSFVFGALANINDMTIAVNSGEDNPKKSKQMRDNIMNNVLKIGTRKSKLAIIQTNIVIDLINKIDKSIICQIVEISTTGDKVLDKGLSEFGGKGVFTDEIENALLDGRIDIAVHSGKDLPIELMEGLEILATPKRELPNDVLVKLKGVNIDENSVIGTSSIRRCMQINCNSKNIRGNVDTRLKKLETEDYDGIILALAGLKRMGINDTDKYDFDVLDIDKFYPAPCQGIIAIEGRSNSRFKNVLNKINDCETNVIFNTERELLKRVGFGCKTPLGAYTNIKNNDIELNAVILKDDNKKYYSAIGRTPSETTQIMVDKIRND